MVLSMLFKKKRLGRRTSAVLTALQGAVARAIRSAGYDPPTTLDIGYVVPLRNHPGGLNINANLMLLRLPCNHRTYHERMMKIDKIFKTEYALLVQLITYWMRLSALLPSTSLQSTAKVGFGTFGPCIALSITPTLLEREYVDGREIVDVFTGASMSLGIGMLINCGGVNGKQRFTFHFDKSVFRDEASAMKIAMFFEEELTALNNLEPFPQSV
ncbi:unnamed protein product [Allacma fusca]|uniref:Uncharacterized protein n=1 Tax=Allacma fusca TaxID=39272 RepID=A0A8J2NZ38_9HEXA|nr:unnamed protein product [Allacma fusca]